MLNKAIMSENAPKAIGPYSQAVQSGNLIFVSGQLPIDPSTGKFAGNDIALQTEQSLRNIKAVLAQAGMDMKDIVKTTVLLSDISDFGAMNEVYAKYFSEPFPARAAFQVAALPNGAKVEIEAVASK